MCTRDFAQALIEQADEDAAKERRCEPQSWMAGFYAGLSVARRGIGIALDPTKDDGRRPPIRAVEV